MGIPTLMNSVASGFYPSPDADEIPDPNRAGQEVAQFGRDRDRVTDTRRQRWNEANWDRDATGNSTTCTEVDELAPAEHRKGDLEQGLAFRRRY
jgi:hypothetical protein